MRGHRNLAADILVPDRLIGAVEQQRAPALLLRIVEQRQRTDQHIDLLGFQRAQHGVDIAGADPGDLVVEPHGFHVIGRPDMVGAAERRHRDDRLAAVGPFPFRQRLQRGDALVLQILADDEHHRIRSGVDRHQHPPGAAVIGQLHRMGDVADADIALRGGDDLAGLDAAAALHQLAVEPGVLEDSRRGRRRIASDRPAPRPDRSRGPPWPRAHARPAASNAPPPAMTVSAERRCERRFAITPAPFACRRPCPAR